MNEKPRIRINAELAARLKRQARRARRKLSQEAEVAIEFYLQAKEAENVR